MKVAGGLAYKAEAPPFYLRPAEGEGALGDSLGVVAEVEGFEEVSADGGFVFLVGFSGSGDFLLCRLPVGDDGALGGEGWEWDWLRFKEVELHFFSSFGTDLVPPEVRFEERGLNDEMEKLGQELFADRFINREMPSYRDVFPARWHDANCTIFQVNLGNDDVSRSRELKAHRVFPIGGHLPFGNGAVEMNRKWL